MTYDLKGSVMHITYCMLDPPPLPIFCSCEHVHGKHFHRHIYNSVLSRRECIGKNSVRAIRNRQKKQDRALTFIHCVYSCCANIHTV